MSNVDSADVANGLLDFTFGPGSVVAGRYQLVRKIGAGGMGSVWLAQDQSLDAPCAVKLVHDDKVTNEEVRARFAREAKSAAQLRSPHVVHVFDHGEADGALYIAMEWLEGEDLSTRLDRVGALDFATTYRIIAHVSRALMAAHAMGIVHRDLKPENVFLVQGYDEEIAKVLDFGIARHSAYSLQDHATRTGSFLGTPFYVSPEQARGKPIDHRADLWSLGVIGFQCLTGRPPFESDALGELMGLILYEPLPVPTAVNPALPAAVDDWWQRAASRDREQRFQSAKELADELSKALGLEPFVTVPPAARSRTSSFPGAMDSSGVFTPFTGEYPADQLPGRASRPSDSSLEEEARLPGPGRLPSDAGFAGARGPQAVALLWRKIQGLQGLKWYAAGLLVVLAGLVVFLAVREDKPTTGVPAAVQQGPTKIVVTTPSPNVPESEPMPIETGINPDSLPIEPPEDAEENAASPRRPASRRRAPAPPPEEPEPAPEPPPTRPNYGI